MARLRRIYLPGVSLHVIQRGNNKSAIFGDDTDRCFFLHLLATASARRAVAVHAFVLMRTHYHLLATPTCEVAMPRMIKDLAGVYTQYYNRRYERIGSIWSGRYDPISILDETYWLTCLRYIEQNPVRAHIVDRPEQYRWSSYEVHAYGTGPAWVADHPLYAGLGPTADTRQMVYKALCATRVAEADIGLLRHGWGQTWGQTPGLTPSSRARVASGNGTGFPAA